MTGDSERSARFEARHFDGITAESHPTEVWIEADGVCLGSATGAPGRWPFAELTLVRGERRDEPVQLERRAVPVEVLIVPDRAFLGRLRSALPAGARLERSGGFAPGARLVIALLAAGIVLLAALYRFAIPALADFAADHVPASWERSYGDAVLASLAPEGERVLDPRLRRPVDEIRARLTGGAGTGAPSLIVVRSGVPNAFTAPGGSVVVTTGLLRALRTPDELAAVLAHELGHVRRRHVMRAIVRQLSLGVLLGLVAGDQSALSGGLRAAGELGALSYSREHEREADDEAIALLERNGASPLALADALESIAGAAHSGLTLGFLSTHPAPEERRARIRAAARSLPSGTPSWGTGWEEMKAALAQPTPADGGDEEPPGPRVPARAQHSPSEAG